MIGEQEREESEGRRREMGRLGEVRENASHHLL